jgi:vacuolar protein sorting-associated protein 35
LQQRDGKQTLQCLQKALKVANSCVETVAQAALFVEILNSYILFFQRGCDAVRWAPELARHQQEQCPRPLLNRTAAVQVTVSHLNKIIALIHEQIPDLEKGEATDLIRVQFQNTLRYISLCKSESRVV